MYIWLVIRLRFPIFLAFFQATIVQAMIFSLEKHHYTYIFVKCEKSWNGRIYVHKHNVHK